MRKHVTKLLLIGAAVALLLAGGSTVLALPLHASVHAQTADDTSTNGDAAGTDPAATAAANGHAHLTAARLKVCQNREKTINTIMSRIDTRAQNQLALFGTIAVRVENFYATSGKTVSNYAQLTAAIDSAKIQAQTDLSAMQSTSTFHCTANNPKGAVAAFRGYLKTEIADLQNYRTSVKDLIVAVAKANGVTVSDSTTQGGQQ